MKKEFLGLIFTIFIITFTLGNVRYDEDEPLNNFFHTNVDNRGGPTELDNLRVTIFFPDLALMVHSNGLDLDNGDVKAIKSFWEDEDIPSGEHFVRVCAHNDKVNECAYRDITF